ncbi:MAG: PaaX family transcriptional regulator [Pelagimonas sp.]|jgi:phenylacetic acid degradation operon negative regulatory protein|nr:PaaX family transcriptional regulator [Pelagimonas sp.]
MSRSADLWFENSIAALNAVATQRVWSVIISLLGDMALAPSDRISGPAITRIVEPMGIRPESKRVALHRLRNDGWIISEKAGRQSLYGLTENGYRQSVEAAPRIYASDERAAGCWQAVILPPRGIGDASESEAQLLALGYIQLAAGLMIGTQVIKSPPDDVLILKPTNDGMPDWVKSLCGSQSAFQNYQTLETALQQVDKLVSKSVQPTPVQVATLRTLIVHNWRRVLLSHADLPPEFFPQGWRGFACRALVMSLLERLDRPALQDIEEQFRRAS